MPFVPEITTNLVQLQVNISSWTAGHHSHVARQEEDPSMGSITSTNREPSHSQSMHRANNWALISILKHWRKVVSVGGLIIHWWFHFSKPLKSKNLGKLQTCGEGQGGWRRGFACLWVWTLLLIRCVTHWHQRGLNVLVPLAAGGRNYLLQHMEVFVQPLTFFFYKSTDILLKEKNPWKGQWISRLWGRQTMNHKCTLGLLCVCVSYLSKS